MKKFSEVEIDSIINGFKELLQSKDIKSINSAAIAMNINSGRLSSFLRKTYEGDINDTAEKVRNYVQLINERKQTENTNDEFVLTRNAEQTLKITRLAHVQKTIGVVIGGAGLGKTKALQQYAELHKDVLYIEANSAYNSREILRELHTSLGGNGIGNLKKLLDGVISKLQDTGRLIIIDQAEYLPDKAIDLIRTIHDKAHIGLVLAGLKDLLSKIRGIGGVHEQIYTRIGAAIELKPLDEEDIQKLVHSYIPGSNGLHKDFIIPCRKNARVLNILCRESKRIAKNKQLPVSADIIAKANLQLIK